MSNSVRWLENRRDYLERLDDENKCTAREFEELVILRNVLEK